MKNKEINLRVNLCYIHSSTGTFEKRIRNITKRYRQGRMSLKTFKQTILDVEDLRADEIRELDRLEESERDRS